MDTDCSLTVDQLVVLMAEAFPGCAYDLRVGAGVTHAILKVWQFEILFSVTTMPTAAMDKAGRGIFFFKQRVGSEIISIRQFPVHHAEDAKEALATAKRYMNGVVAAILSTYEV